MTSQLLVTSQMQDHMSETFAAWLISLGTMATWGQKSGERPRGVEAGALFRARTSDPCVSLFVWATRLCASCHQLEKTSIMCMCACVCELKVQVLCMWVSGLWWSGGMTISEHGPCEKIFRNTCLWNFKSSFDHKVVAPPKVSFANYTKVHYVIIFKFFFFFFFLENKLILKKLRHHLIHTQKPC